MTKFFCEGRHCRGLNYLPTECPHPIECIVGDPTKPQPIPQGPEDYGRATANLWPRGFTEACRSIGLVAASLNLVGSLAVLSYRGPVRHLVRRADGQAWQLEPETACGIAYGLLPAGWGAERGEVHTVSCRRCVQAVTRLILAPGPDGLLESYRATARRRRATQGRRSIQLYRPHRLAGRCLSGSESGGGKLVHAVPVTDEGAPFERSICRAAPGRTSAGWSPAIGPVTCSKCERSLRRSLHFSRRDVPLYVALPDVAPKVDDRGRP